MGKFETTEDEGAGLIINKRQSDGTVKTYTADKRPAKKLPRVVLKAATRLKRSNG